MAGRQGLEQVVHGADEGPFSGGFGLAADGELGIRQLSVRGKAKAAAEWTFICAVHNLFKALSTGHLTLQALAALAS